MQVNKTCINTQLKHAWGCSRQMKDIFSCWKSARLPLIFGNYIFGNYSFGKYFLSLRHLTGFRLKKSMGIFMTIGDPCGNFEKTLTWHRSLWLASHRVWEIHGAECLGKTWGTEQKTGAIWTEDFPIQLLRWYEKKRRKNQQNINTSASKGCSLFSPKKKKRWILRTSMRDVFFFTNFLWMLFFVTGMVNRFCCEIIGTSFSFEVLNW